MRFVYFGELPRDKQTNWSEECQGLTHDQDHWFIAQKGRIWRTPVGKRLNQDLDKSQSATIPDSLKRKHFDHIGDLDHFAGRLYAPLENGGSPKSAAHVALFDAATLDFIGSAPVTGMSMPWCAVNPADGLLYTSVFHPSGIHRYTVQVTGGGVSVSEVTPLPLLDEQGASLKLHNVQGGAFAVDGAYLLLACDAEDAEGTSKGFSVFETASGRRIAHRSVSYDPIISGGEIEGIDAWSLTDPQDGSPNALIHVLVLNNDWPTDDNIMIKTWRAIFDAPAPPKPVAPVRDKMR